MFEFAVDLRMFEDVGRTWCNVYRFVSGCSSKEVEQCGQDMMRPCLTKCWKRQRSIAGSSNSCKTGKGLVLKCCWYRQCHCRMSIAGSLTEAMLLGLWGLIGLEGAKQQFQDLQIAKQGPQVVKYIGPGLEREETQKHLQFNLVSQEFREIKTVEHILPTSLE